MDPHPARPALALLLILSAAPAFAQGQLHKCVDAQGKVTYQDFPCGQKPALGASEASPGAAVHPPAADGTSSPLMRQLDAAVRAAIAGRDLERARSLAVTARHWEWIAAAEKELPAAPPVTGRTPADLRAEKSASPECREARRNYENETRSPEAIEKMKQLMYEACGMDPPTTAGGAPSLILVPARPQRFVAPPVVPAEPPPPPRRATEPSRHAPVKGKGADE